MKRDFGETPRLPRILYEDDYETTRLSVQCTDESHSARPWLVDSFYLDTEAPFGSVWLASTTYWRDGKSIAQLPRKGSRSLLVEDRVISKEDFKAKVFVLDNGSRSRYSFKCGICSLSVSRRSEAVTEAFDRIAAAGVSEISLAGLAAILLKR